MTVSATVGDRRYRNLEDHPEVEVQIRGDRFSARARTAEAEEKPEMWRTMTEVWPDYDAYQERTDRDVPVVVFERSLGLAWSAAPAGVL